MAIIQHKDIPDAQLHEPKGIASATVGQTYVADGAGGGVWKLEQAYGEMQVLQNSTALAVTAATDSTLYTTSDYIKITGIWSAGVVDGITYANDQLTVPVTGVYHLAGWANTTSSASNVLVGVKYAINGTVIPSNLAPTIRRKIGTGTDIGSISGIGLVSLTAGDVISLYLACDTTCNITVPDAGLSLHLVKS